MNASIFEIKCSINNPEEIHTLLYARDASFQGEDHQLDTYFNVPSGRLKIREGNIENSIIRYHRTEVKNIKKSKVHFQTLSSDQAKNLKGMMADTLGIWKVVRKARRIYFIDNVKFHIDEVDSLGWFVEIEAIDTNTAYSDHHLEAQCAHYIDYLNLDRTSFIDQSYSDMISVANS